MPDMPANIGDHVMSGRIRVRTRMRSGHIASQPYESVGRVDPYRLQQMDITKTPSPDQVVSTPGIVPTIESVFLFDSGIIISPKNLMA